MEQLHIHLYGEVGWDITVDSVQRQLEGVENAEEIVMHIASPGGGVFEGWTIGNIIKAKGKPTTAIIEGMCASIATYIALQANTIKMVEDGTRFMIHNPTTFTEGDAKDMVKAAQQLAEIKNDLMRVYSRKTGMSEAELSKMMDEETWMDFAQAERLGFVDDKAEPQKAVAKFDISNMSTQTQEPTQPDKSGLLDKLMNKVNTMLNNSFKTAKNIFVELQGGGMVYVETEDGDFVGKRVLMVDADGNITDQLAPAGDHNLADGRTITVDAAGMITAITEMPESAEAALKRMEEENASLKEQITALQQSETTLRNENETITKAINEQKTQMMEIVNEIKSIKEVTVGEGFKAQKVHTAPPNKDAARKEKQTSGLDGWAMNLMKDVNFN